MKKTVNFAWAKFAQKPENSEPVKKYQVVPCSQVLKISHPVKNAVKKREFLEFIFVQSGYR